MLQGPGPVRLYAQPSRTERLLTVREVAERLSICTATVYGLCERGELPHIRVSNATRVRPVDVEAFSPEARADPVVPGSRSYGGNRNRSRTGARFELVKCSRPVRALASTWTTEYL
ncbi:helix-turn-helix domain-containing protein [Myxococcus xanthus]|uniref:helix-turn-helix domain-containing protein n=1 Tax=Myxococcus xanthus TaxID=34 RepID=UPI00112B7F4C